MKRSCIGMLVFGFLCVSFVWAQTPAEFKGHADLIYSVAFTVDGKTLATASFDNTVKLWDFATGKELTVLKGHTGPVYGVAFNNDGTVVATGSLDKTIRLWNPKDGKLIQELKGHADIVQSVAFSSDGKYLVSGSTDKSVRLWDVKSYKEIKNIGTHKKSVYGVAFSSDGTQIASCGDDGIIKIYDVKDQKEIKSMMVDLPKKEIKKVEEPKDKDKDKDKDKKVIKKDAGKKEEPPEIRDAFNGVVFSPDGKFILTVDSDKYLRYWSLADGKETKKFGRTHDWLNGVAISRDGKFVATAGYGGSIRVYEIGTGKMTYPIPGADEEKDKDKLKVADLPRRGAITYSVVFTPDGKSVVTGQHDLKTGKGVAKVISVLK